MQILIDYSSAAIDTIIRYAPRLGIALVLALAGWKAANLLCAGIARAMDAKCVDQSLRPFIISLAGYAIKVALAVALIGYLGIPTASFVAVIGAAGLAVGMALSGTLQNFAGGVVLLMLRPIRVGEFVDVAGHLGKVHEIHVFHTVLLTPDNRTVYLPNSTISNQPVTNFSRQQTRRVDLTFGIGYDDDIDRAKAIISRLIGADDRVLRDPAPLIAVDNLGDSSVDLLLRFWTKSADFLAIQHHLNEAVKKAFDAEGVSIPFPQRDVHVIQPPQASAG
jgi:small conductance mechanosensitive channel